MIQLVGCVVIAVAVYLVIRRFDVRLVLLLAALVLGALGGHPEAVLQMFLKTFSDERYVVPICTAMGFAYVLRFTGCDKHLVHLLMKPVQRVRFLLIPGTVVVGFLVNIPVVSQSSTAVTIGPVAVPVLLAARFTPATVGSVLLLGSSVGGELLNPGAPELRTVIEKSEEGAKKKAAEDSAGDATKLETEPRRVTSEECMARIRPLNLLGLAAATLTLWLLSRRAERSATEAPATPPADLPPDDFRVNWLHAAVPLIPLVLLFLTGPPLNLLRVPPRWLIQPVNEDKLTSIEQGLFDSRLIGAAMLIGVLAAAAVVWRKGLAVTGTFFEGAGYGFTHIISLIVTANCFGKGVEVIGLDQSVAALIGGNAALLLTAAGVLSLGFAFVSGSGMATTTSLFPFFVLPALRLGVDPTLVGAVVALGSAAGRTMSPVSAVTLMSASLTRTEPLQLVRRVAPPLLAAVAVVVIGAIIMASAGW
jgi:DcuC family C4-dicarboxylate transporter